EQLLPQLVVPVAGWPTRVERDLIAQRAELLDQGRVVMTELRCQEGAGEQRDGRSMLRAGQEGMHVRIVESFQVPAGREERALAAGVNDADRDRRRQLADRQRRIQLLKLLGEPASEAVVTDDRKQTTWHAEVACGQRRVAGRAAGTQLAVIHQ